MFMKGKKHGNPLSSCPPKGAEGATGPLPSVTKGLPSAAAGAMPWLAWCQWGHIPSSERHALQFCNVEHRQDQPFSLPELYKNFLIYRTCKQTNLETPILSWIREEGKVKTSEKNNMATTKVSAIEGGGRGGAPCIQVEVLLQAMVGTTIQQTISL